MRKHTVTSLCGISKRNEKEWCLISKSNVTLLHSRNKNMKAVINYKSTRAVMMIKDLADLVRIVKQVEAMEDNKREFIIT